MRAQPRVLEDCAADHVDGGHGPAHADAKSKERAGSCVAVQGCQGEGGGHHDKICHAEGCRTDLPAPAEHRWRRR